MEDAQGEHLRAAAVLLLVQGADLWFIQRSSTLRQHAGQIAFPGGREEPEDGDLWRTALRESEEEIGIDPNSVVPLGRLHECWTPTGFRIRPYLGWNAGAPLQPRPNYEVERAFTMPVAELMLVRPVLPWPKYPTPAGDIWGATARILHQWLELLREAVHAEEA